ncbi:MAG: acyl-CoA dehydrogenase domain-containing protein, partial [Thermodesulfobacteriota bacterium]
AFAWTADVSMFLLGGSLKRYEDDGRPAEDLPLLHWSVRDALARTEEAFYGLIANLPNRFVAGVMLRAVIFPFAFPLGREFSPPRDRLGSQVVGLLLAPGPARERLTAGVYLPRDPDEPVAVLEAALRAVIAAEPIGAKIRQARERGVIASGFADPMVDEACAKGVITQAEKEAMKRARELRRRVIMVDDFPKDLGRTEIHQTTQPVTFEALRGRTSWPELERRDHDPSPAP